MQNQPAHSDRVEQCELPARWSLDQWCRVSGRVAQVKIVKLIDPARDDVGFSDRLASSR